MTYSTSSCLATKLWIHGMYICMYVCMYGGQVKFEVDLLLHRKQEAQHQVQYESWESYGSIIFLRLPKVKLSLYLPIRNMVTGVLVPLIVNLGTKWQWAVSFTPRPLYSQENIPWQLLNRRLIGYQSGHIRLGESEIESVFCHPACNQPTVPPHHPDL